MLLCDESVRGLGRGCVVGGGVELGVWGVKGVAVPTSCCRFPWALLMSPASSAAGVARPPGVLLGDLTDRPRVLPQRVRQA